MEVRGEAGDDEPAIRVVAEQIAHRFAHGRLGRREARSLGVRRVGEEETDPSVSPGDPAGVVLMGVRQHDALDPFGVLAQVREVGEHEIDARHVRVGEHQPAVDDEDAALDLDAEAVAPDLAQPAEEDEPHFVAHRADATDRTRPASGRWSRARYALAGSRSFETSSSVAYSSPVSVQSSNWITPNSVNRSRSQPSPAS